MQIKNAKCQSWTMKIRTGCASLAMALETIAKVYSCLLVDVFEGLWPIRVITIIGGPCYVSLQSFLLS